MEESPNLLYVKEIACEDYAFEKQFVTLFKEEFSWEVGMYLNHIKNNEPRAAAEIVGRSKYKLSMLGLKKAFSLATDYELKLHTGDTALDDEFRKILRKVSNFLMKV